MLRRTLLAGLAVLGLAVSAQAGPVYLHLVVDPATTAGAGIPTVARDFANPAATFSVTSNKSGAGSWHLYASDDVQGSFGIAFFSVGLNPGAGGTITNTFNRSPNGAFDTLDDETNSTGGSGAAGFSDGLLRSGNNIIPVQGAQVIGSLNRIGFLGQTAGSFNNTPNLPVPPSGGSRTWSGITSGAWGNYATNTPKINGKSWLLLGEGNYTGPAPSINFTATSTVLYYASGDFQSQGQAPISDIPEPATIALIGLAVVGGLGFRRRSA